MSNIVRQVAVGRIEWSNILWSKIDKVFWPKLHSGALELLDDAHGSHIYYFHHIVRRF